MLDTISNGDKHKYAFEIERSSVPSVVPIFIETKHRPTATWRHGRAVRQRSAKPFTPVQLRLTPPENSGIRSLCLFAWSCTV